MTNPAAYGHPEDLPPIIKDWISQLCSPDIIQLVKHYGDRRRIDVTLFSDRGKVPRPPTGHIT